MLVDKSPGYHLHTLSTRYLDLILTMDGEKVRVQQKSILKDRTWLAPGTRGRLLNLWQPLDVNLNKTRQVLNLFQGLGYLCNGWKVWSNGTTSVPKSVPRSLVDKVRIIRICGFWLQFLCSIKVPNKSLSQELNNFLKVFLLVSNKNIELCL